MRTYILAGLLGTPVLVVWYLLKRHAGWKVLHQQVVATLVLLYGVYLAMLAGTSTHFVVPGIGALGSGAAAGAAIGLATYLVVGAVGVATGGVGISLGLGAMTLMGAGVGAAGGASGAAGFTTVSYSLISPLFWIPIVLLSAYLFIGAWMRSRSARAEKQE